MSNHSVEVIRVILEPVPTADTLALVRIGGYQCLVRKEEWKDGDLGAYVAPDSLVDGDRPEFAFLGAGKKHRIKAKKLRGVISHGLLVAAPAGMEEGQDAAEALGVEHYEPPVQGESGSKFTAGPTAKGPDIPAPVYDLENICRYSNVLLPGEPVMITEKIHGANARFVYYDGQVYCGSRTTWKLESEGSSWWMAYKAEPMLQSFLQEHPGWVVYGEIYGRVQSLHYGIKEGCRLAVFDILGPKGWLWPEEARQTAPSLPWVPTLFNGPFDMTTAKALADGPSQVAGADHHREGCVIEPLTPRYDPKIGRVKLKAVGNDYLLGKH